MNARFELSGPLRGSLRPPADKSISHRAAIIGAMSSGHVEITNYLDAADTNSTLAAVTQLGVSSYRNMSNGNLQLLGVGLHGARSNDGVIDVGNAGTLMRLLPGWLAFQEGASFTLDGDDSIRGRPVDRIAEPLRRMGAQIEARGNRLPPFTVRGTALTPIEYELPVASAQVKSCVLLAGLGAPGTSVIEPIPTRDHTERLLLRAGVPVERDGARTQVGKSDQLGVDRVDVPGDLSSAAFMIAAALLVPGSEIVLQQVGVNWTRTGFLRIVERMGAIVGGDLEPPGSFGAEEPIADLEIRASALHGTTVEPGEVPLAIDELPLVALLGCFAAGETVVTGAAELKVKESDRIATVVDGLRQLGGTIEATDDGFVVTGTGGLRGGTIDSHGDHRLALLGAVAGLASADGVQVFGMEAAGVSYPGFGDDIARLVS